MFHVCVCVCVCVCVWVCVCVCEYIKDCPTLKGRFSSGIEDALASILINDFNWKKLSEIILCILF